MRCPRQESNLRARFRKPALYPLSYGGEGLGNKSCRIAVLEPSAGFGSLCSIP
jgi:hypothetical protein